MHQIRVTWHTGGPKGAWLPDPRVISLQYGMSDTQTRCTLAHELGHALQHHPACAEDKLEHQADKWAATVLIDPDDYAQAEHIHDGHPGAIADELGVTLHLLATWQEINHTRLKEKRKAA